MIHLYKKKCVCMCMFMNTYIYNKHTHTSDLFTSPFRLASHFSKYCGVLWGGVKSLS